MKPLVIVFLIVVAVILFALGMMALAGDANGTAQPLMLKLWGAGAVCLLVAAAVGAWA